MRAFPAAALLVALALPAGAAVVGTNRLAESVTAERIAALPAAERPAWIAYLARSQAQAKADRAALLAERASLAAIPPAPAGGNGVNTMPLDRPSAWYAGPDAARIAATVLSFQTPAGGWGKNQPRDAAPRLPGQSYVAGDVEPATGPGDNWHYVGTIDNGATTHEIRFLSRVAAASGSTRYRDGALRGIRYLLAAQYPNGGWPQVWPLEGKYHDAITLNDNAMTEVLDLLTDVADGRGDFAFVPRPLRAQARAAAAHGLDCIVRMQVRVDGRARGWGQQHDALTLAITSARNYEPAALAAPETASLILYLRRLPRLTPALNAAIASGTDWLRASAIHGTAWRDAGDGQGRALHPDPAAPLLWARFYTLDTNRPIFGERDLKLHDDVMDLQPGRRRGYGWYSTAPGALFATRG